MRRPASNHHHREHPLRHCAPIARAALALWLAGAAAIAWAASADTQAQCGPPEPSEPPSAATISLADALAAALRHHPELVLAECELQAAEARMRQAGVRPNPEAGIEVENIAGSGEVEGFRAAETTLQLSQLIELGGKRARRLRAAGLERDLVAWDRERRRLDVVTRTRKAYIEVLAAQEAVGEAAGTARLAQELLGAVAERVKAGKVSPIDQTRATVAGHRAALQEAQARNRLEAARRRLALNWGSETAGFREALGELETLPPRPSLEALEHALRNSPDLARWATEVELRRSALDVARAEGVMDLSVSGGVRQLAESDDVALVLGLSMPLPLFDRKEGAIAEAEARMLAVDAAIGQARREALSALYERYDALVLAESELRALREQVLPLAEQALEATATGYREGKFGYIDVLDAQRALLDARGEHLGALARYHMAAAELEGLVGTALERVLPDSTGPGGLP